MKRSTSTKHVLTGFTTMQRLDSETVLPVFYKAIQAWIDAGCPKNTIFRKSVGLCGNLSRFVSYHFPGKSKMAFDASDRMTDSFRAAGLSWLFPFNDFPDLRGYKCWHYEKEAQSGKTYKNEARLNWIKEHSK